MKRILTIIVCFVLLLSVFSCSSDSNQNKNGIKFYNYVYSSTDSFYVNGKNGKKYYEISTFSDDEYGFDKWDCESGDFRKMGKIENIDNATAYSYKGSDGEIKIIKMVRKDYPYRSRSYFFIDNDDYPLDIFKTGLSNEITVNGKSVKLSDETGKTITLDGIVETEICYPRSDEEHYTKTKSHIKVICKDFSMLSRTFDVYSDENSDYYIAIDQAYFLKIKDSSIIEKLITGEKK